MLATDGFAQELARMHTHKAGYQVWLPCGWMVHMTVLDTLMNKSRLWSLIPSGAFAGAMTMPSPVQQINACSQPQSL